MAFRETSAQLPAEHRGRVLVRGDSGAGVHGRTLNDVLISATLKPQGPAYVPNDLIWYSNEKFWKSMADTRLELGPETYSLSVSNDVNFGVDARVSAKVQGLGFDIGGIYDSLSPSSG
jgi:hypothetical protein